MTQTEALKLALEALERGETDLRWKAITAIKEALAQPEQRRTMADCPNCEYHKNRAARWRAEAYKQAGHDVIELPWVGLTKDEIEILSYKADENTWKAVELAEAKLKEKNA